MDNPKKLKDTVKELKKRNHHISKDGANEQINRFRHFLEPKAFKGKKPKPEFILHGTIKKEQVIALLSIENCIGLRIYNAIDNAGKQTFVLTGVDSIGKNITPVVTPSSQSKKNVAKKAVDKNSGFLNDIVKGPPYPDEEI